MKTLFSSSLMDRKQSPAKSETSEVSCPRRCEEKHKRNERCQSSPLPFKDSFTFSTFFLAISVFFFRFHKQAE